MAHAMTTSMILLMVLILLTMLLVVPLVLIFVAYVRLHISLMMSVHHDVLALLMTLVVHCVRIVVGRLGDWRPRG